MEQLIQVIFIIAICKYCLKAALGGSFKHICLYGFIAAIFAIAIYPFVISQSMNVIQTFLSDKKVVCDAAVLTSFEAIAGIFISLSLLDNYFKPKNKRSNFLRLVKIIPGFICFIGIGYFELQFFKLLVGFSFETIVFLYSLSVFVGILIVSYGLRYLLIGESDKLEFKIILNILILILGLLVYSSVADYNLSNAQTVIEWKALGTLSLIFIACIALGYFLSKINFKHLKQKSKWIK